jgi:putative transposase
VEKTQVNTELAPEVVLTTATGEVRKSNKKVRLNLEIGTRLVEVQMYVAVFKHPIILGRPFTKQYNKEIDIVEEKVFGISNCAEVPLVETFEKELQTQKIEYIDSNQFLRDIRPKEADIGMFYITEETLEKGKEVPEFVKSEFSDVVTNESPQRLPEFKSVTHRIHLIPGAKPTARPPYRMSQYETEELKKQIEELLQHGFIQMSSSPFAAPVLFVKKKDKALRLCVDFRLLNLNTIKNAFPLPVIEDLFMKIGNTKVFSKLDLMSGYFQIRVDPKDEEKTGFVTPFGHYHWKVMPFGVVNGPATFQSFMNQILGDTPNVLVYLDDILIYSHTKEEHEKDVKRVLQILRDNKLIAKKKKCEFFKNTLEFLGHTITPNGIVPNDAKIKAIIDWPKPMNAKDAMKFMGLCNYYRKFVQGFSKISSPINEFMAEHCQWGEKQDQAFRILKEKLTTSPILVLPDFNKEFRLTTDASDTAIGATLEQVDENNKIIGVIGYFSKKLIGAQINYFVMEKEFLAIIESLKHFRSILYGRRFVLRSDHLSLTYIMSQGKVPQKSNSKMVRFSIRI